MTPDRPTLAAIRLRAQKGRHREIGNWLARRVGRPSAVYGTWVAVRLGLSAHGVTAMAMATSIVSALSIGLGTRVGFVVGVVLAHLAFWLDHVDGQVARWRGTSSLDGVYLDYLMHHVVAMTGGFALGYGLTSRTGEPRWTVAGFVIALGWTFLSLHNDCRYKSMFQRLKRESRSFRVDGGSGGRPSPPARWPRSGPGLVTWPAYKLCEPHAVLIALTALALIALISATAWLELWRLGVVGMALLAPTLALARAARSVARGSTEAEFDRWFRPVEEERIEENHPPMTPMKSNKLIFLNPVQGENPSS